MTAGSYKEEFEDTRDEFPEYDVDEGYTGPDLADDPMAAVERPRSRFSEYLMSFLSGNILSRSEARRVYPFLLLVAFLAFVYIGNVFRMQQLYRQHSRLTEEVKEMRAKSMTMSARRVEATRQSNVILEIERRGLPLRESLTPNKVIPEN